MKDRLINVLLIEDNPGDARLIEEMLIDVSDTNFNLECAERLSDGMEYLSKEEVDIVLLDLGLPDSTGLDTFEKVHTKAPQVPIVMLTGLDDNAVALEGVRMGAQDYLTKSRVDSNMLERAICYAIERKSAQKHIHHLNSVLKAIRTINQTIAQKTNRDHFLQKVCDILVDARGYNAVWFGIIKDDGKFITVKGSGFEKDISRFSREVMARNHPPCIRDALESEETVRIVDKEKKCGDCFLRDVCLGGEIAIIHVKHAERLFGLLAVSFASGIVVDDEEKTLLAELALDIARALRGREMEKAHKKAEIAIKQSEERLRLVIENMPVMLDAFDEKGKIIVWNSECEEVTGFSSNEIIGNPKASGLLYPDKKMNKYIYSMLKKYGNNFRNLEWDITCKDGNVKTILWSNISEEYPIPNWYSWAVGIDITERKKAQDQIERSLKEKEVLLREIHHRVKNNLQVISSLLNIQARGLKDKKIIDVLSESRDRINAMSFIHTQLYESRDLSRISIKEFVKRLLGQLLLSYPVNETRITQVVRVDMCLLPVSIAVPVGLIINELLSNAIKYAFIGREEGEIRVCLSTLDNGRINMKISDNGIGLPHGFDIDTSKSLGLRLVKILTQDQLQGNLEIISDQGTTLIIEFDIEDNGGD